MESQRKCMTEEQWVTILGGVSLLVNKRIIITKEQQELVERVCRQERVGSDTIFARYNQLWDFS